MTLSRLRQIELSGASRLIIGGDIHGDYESFRRIVDVFNPDCDYLIFLGDYADRGPRGVEVVDGVAELAGKYPTRVIALKGNHEYYADDGEPTFTPCDLIGEAQEKRNGWQTYFDTELKPFIERLYVAALVPSEVLFVHGGVSSKIRGIDDLRYPSKDIEEDLLWSDPFEGYGEHPNMRGAGVQFGRDVTEEVCRKIGVKRIVRSHEPRKAWQGPCVEQDGRVVTVSSTAVYGGMAFLLKLPSGELSEAFERLERHVVKLR